MKLIHCRDCGNVSVNKSAGECPACGWSGPDDEGDWHREFEPTGL